MVCDMLHSAWLTQELQQRKTKKWEIHKSQIMSYEKKPQPTALDYKENHVLLE